MNRRIRWGRVFEKVQLQKLYKKHYKTSIKRLLKKFIMVYKSYIKALQQLYKSFMKALCQFYKVFVNALLHKFYCKDFIKAL